MHPCIGVGISINYQVQPENNINFTLLLACSSGRIRSLKGFNVCVCVTLLYAAVEVYMQCTTSITSRCMLRILASRVNVCIICLLSHSFSDSLLWIMDAISFHKSPRIYLSLFLQLSKFRVGALYIQQKIQFRISCCACGMHACIHVKSLYSQIHLLTSSVCFG